ncbi:hypothetical protein [Colwellia sp. RSH04]|uniref:hypothetical protein n=1 Tax=Colwellia sp. RSH04 TaxID=2305464 RepID=UPI000E593DC0|nr:hypothetical protein [Colwellia sp. RSH04]RHW75450.1 hypothetical protein D1094_13745 [Colwellia sp. RSH04]
MTTIDEILICANQLANQGKKPTVALIKAKLINPAPLPMIISTLKSWQHDPDFITLKNDEVIELSKENNVTTSEEVKLIIQQTLNEELAEMKRELSDLKDLIKQLSKRMNP